MPDMPNSQRTQNGMLAAANLARPVAWLCRAYYSRVAFQLGNDHTCAAAGMELEEYTTTVHTVQLQADPFTIVISYAKT